MVLAVMMSALASALLSATPVPVSIEPLGFSVQSDGEQVTVTVVKKGSVAAKAGLKRGMRIERIDMPQRPFARGPIGKLNETDLHDALIPTWDEPLRVRVREGEEQRFLVLARKDRPPASEFPVIPLHAEQLQRLTYIQQARYFAHLASYRPAREQEPKRKPELKLEHEATARVVGGKLKRLEGGGFTPAWVYVRATLDASCERPLEKVVLRGTTPGMPRTFTRSPGSPESYARFAVDLPLWKPAAVARVCASKVSSLEVKLRGELYCKGVPVRKTALTVKLAVACEQASEEDDFPEKFSLRVLDRPGATLPANQLVVGSHGAIELYAYLGNLTPRPSEVSLVELDARGEVSRRLVHRKVTAEEREPKFPIELDTKEPRIVLLALEVKFPDGSVQVGAPEEVKLLTEEQIAEQRRSIEEAYARMQAFERKLGAAWKDPCDKLEDTVAWLKDQPEIEWASGEGRHSFSYKVKGALAPLIFSCHSP